MSSPNKLKESGLAGIFCMMGQCLCSAGLISMYMGSRFSMKAGIIMYTSTNGDKVQYKRIIQII